MMSIFAFAKDDGFSFGDEEPAFTGGAEDDDGDEEQEADRDGDIDAGVEE